MSSLRNLNLLLSTSGFSRLAFNRQFSTTRSVYQNASENELLTTIKNQLKVAMRNKDSSTSGVIRSLLSDHQYSLKTNSKTPPSLISIIKKSISRRNEASLQFRSAKPPREDLADKEDQEIQLLSKFLPSQMSRDQIVKLVKGTLEELKDKIEGEKGGKVLGMVQKAIMEKVDKNTVEGSEVSKIVKELLEKK